MNLKIFKSPTSGGSRLPWIDYSRGIAIFLVLYRHIFEGIKRSGLSIERYAYLEHANIIFFSFRMPLFFIISGIFIHSSLKKRGLSNFIETKWKMLLYPYLLWAIIQISLQLLFSNFVNADRSYRDYLYILYAPREIDQFWYLYALFNTSVIYAITTVKFKWSKWLQLIIGLFAFYFSGYLTRHNVDLGFIYDILHYYIFIAFGGVLYSYILNKENFRFLSSWKLFIVIIPVFCACQWYFLQTNLANHDYHFVEDYQSWRFIIIALSGCIFMTNIAFILQRYKALSFFRIIGYYSLYIYLMHVLASSAVRIILVHVFGISNVPLLLILGIFAGLIIPVFIYTLAMRLGAWWLFSLEKPKSNNKSPQDMSENIMTI
jgi:fucose 4-O-acetylase-like acetyltransferase